MSELASPSVPVRYIYGSDEREIALVKPLGAGHTGTVWLGGERAADYQLITQRPQPIVPLNQTPGAKFPINPAIETMVMKMLRLDPTERYQNAGEIVKELQRILYGRELPGPPLLFSFSSSSSSAIKSSIQDYPASFDTAQIGGLETLSQAEKVKQHWLMGRFETLPPLYFKEAISCLSFSADGKLLAIGAGKIIKLVEVGTDHNCRDYGLLEGLHPISGVASVAFNHSTLENEAEPILIAATSINTIKVWEAKSGRLLHDLRNTEQLFSLKAIGWVNQVCFSPDNKMLASCSDDRTIRL